MGIRNLMKVSIYLTQLKKNSEFFSLQKSERGPKCKRSIYPRHEGSMIGVQCHWSVEDLFIYQKAPFKNFCDLQELEELHVVNRDIAAARLVVGSEVRKFLTEGLRALASHRGICTC